MPYKLRKSPKKDLYWVSEIETGKKYSKLPIPLNKAKAQMRVLEAALNGGIRLPRGMHNPSDEEDYDLEDEIERSINPPPPPPPPRRIRHPLPNDEPDAPPKAVRHPRRDDEPEEPEGPPPAKMSRTSGRSGRGKKGGISYKKFENFLEHLRSIEKHELGNEWYVNSDGRLEFYGNFMEPVMALVQAYFSPPEYEKINNSIAKRNIMRLLQTVNINEFISLVRELYSGKFEGLIKAFINDVESGKLNIEQQLDKTIELLRLVIIQILREVLEEYAQDPVDLSKYKKEFKPSDKYKKRGGMLRNPLLVLKAEKDAKKIIQMNLTESDEAKGFANGKYSMEEILNRSIQSLIRSDKQEAVAYVQKLIAEYSSNPKYKVQTREARQELAKAMGFTTGGKKPGNRVLGRKLKGGVTAVQLRSVKNDVARLFPTLKTKYSLNPITGQITISAGPSEDVFGLFDASFQHWITPSEYAQIIKTSEYRNFRDFLQSRHIIDSIRIAQRIAGTVNFNDFDYFSNTLLELFRELRLVPVDSREQKLIVDKIINVYESFRHDMSFLAWKKLEELLIGPGVKVVNTSDGDYTYVSTPAPGRKEFLPYPLKRGIGKKGGMMPGAIAGNPKEGPTREIVNPMSRRVLDPSVPRRVLDASAPRRIFVPESEPVPTVLETIKDCLDCKKSSSGKGKSKKCSKCGKFKV